MCVAVIRRLAAVVVNVARRLGFASPHSVRAEAGSNDAVDAAAADGAS